MPDLPNFPVPTSNPAPTASAPVGTPSPAPLFRMPENVPVQQQSAPAPVQQQQPAPPLGVAKQEPAPTSTPAPVQQQPTEKQPPTARTAARDPRLISVTIPKHARAAAQHLSRQLDEDTRHIYAAAILAFEQFPAEAKMQWVQHARLAYAASPLE